MPFFREYKIGDMEMSAGTPVAVIATFKTDGMIKPLRVRFEGQEGPVEANIDTMLYAEQTFEFLYTFKCLITLNSIQRHITLTYKTNTNIWRVMWK